MLPAVVFTCGVIIKALRAYCVFFHYPYLLPILFFSFVDCFGFLSLKIEVSILCAPPGVSSGQKGQNEQNEKGKKGPK
jgi:hypothetical protein